MEYLLVGLASFAVALLTLFSGFGIGTLLLPVFAFFFPLRVAVAVTAVVHFLTNLFKFALLGKHAQWKTAFVFGVPALLSASLGAWLLNWLAAREPWLTYQAFGRTLEVMPIAAVVGVLIIVFALFDLVPRLRELRIESGYLLPIGGVLSGFFGGLSGHQGALRSTFLIKTGLRKEQFIATGVVISFFVDITRLVVYATDGAFRADVASGIGLLGTATLAAFAGSLVGRLLLEKVTLGAVRTVVGILLLVVGLGLASGMMGHEEPEPVAESREPASGTGSARLLVR